MLRCVMIKRKPKVIFFDYGGTLVVENKFDNYLGLKSALQDAKIDIDDNAIRKTAEILKSLHKEMLSIGEDYNIEILTLSVMKAIFSQKGITLDFDKERFEYVFWKNATSHNLVENVTDVLEALKKRNIITGVISNLSFTGNTLKKIIDDLLPDNNFCCVLSSADYLFRKPNPIIFEIALNMNGITSAQNVWYCGNSLKNDILGAKNAGMYPVLFDSGHKEDNTDEVLDYATIHCFEELLNLIDN